MGHHIRPAQPRWSAIVLSLALGMATALLGPASSASAVPTAGPPATSELASRHQVSPPTIVLVHGAFADASGWTAEVVALQRLGFTVLAPANPLRGLTFDSDYLRSILATIDGPVILVGHSYGGAVITNAARGATNVIALVYAAAFIPDTGSSVATSYDPATYPGSLLTLDALDIRPVPNPLTPDGHDADLTIRPDLFREIFAGDQSPRTSAAMAATQRPLSAFAYTEPSGEPAWENLPSWDLVTLDDRAISPGGQLFMARRAGAKITTIHSAHDVMISHPRAVVELITTAVHATAGR